MIKYRPHRGSLIDAMKEEKTFNTIDEMYNYVLSEWNNSGFGELFNKEELSITETLGVDERIDWKEYRYVCTNRMGNKTFDIPQCIGMCSIEN